MTLSVSHKFWLPAALSVLALVACGGGGTSVTTPAVAADASDKYVGVWTRCFPYKGTVPSGNLAYSDKLTITKVSATSYKGDLVKLDHSDTACASAGVVIPGDGGATVFTITGTKTIGADTVDTVTSLAGGGALVARNVIYVNLAGPTLQVGDASSTLDAAGFYNGLEPVRFAKK